MGGVGKSNPAQYDDHRFVRVGAALQKGRGRHQVRDRGSGTRTAARSDAGTRDMSTTEGKVAGVSARCFDGKRRTIPSGSPIFHAFAQALNNMHREPVFDLGLGLCVGARVTFTTVVFAPFRAVGDQLIAGRLLRRA